MKIINLLPKSERTEVRLQMVASQLTSFWIYVVVSMLVLCVLAFLVNILLRNQITQSSNDISDRQLELSSSNTQQLESRVLTLNGQVRSIKNLEANHYQWSEALIEISRVTPQNVTLNILDIDTLTGKVSVTGFAPDRDAVIEFWSNVKKSTSFRNINFPFTNLEKENDATFSYIFYLERDKFKYESDN